MTEARKPQDAASEESDREAVAIMVHGTFAGAEEDAGEHWWQAESPVAEKIQSLVPESTRVAEGSEVFHWSGENSDRARSKAAGKLLRHVQRLEEEGREYHLVGHSHGGSVIWNALQMSVLMKRPLKGLRSWTTIGTPFMQHRSPGALNVKNLLGLIIGLVMLVPAMAAPRQLVTTLYNIAVDNRAALVLDPDDRVGYANILRTPVLALVDGFGIPIDRQPDGVTVGSFDPNGNMPLAQYFFATPEGLFLLLLMIGLSYFFMHCTVLCIAPAIESFRLRLEHKLLESAFKTYGGRWLGIWSPDDEAINGLRATLGISVSFVSKMVPREVVYVSDMFGLLSRPYYWLLAPLYNRFVHPAVDGKVRNIVVRAAQGSDRPSTSLIDVTPYPMVSDTFSPPPLPALLNVKLLSFANRHAHELVPKLRSLMAQTAFTGGLESFGGQLSGRELVHTAYFEQDEVLKLIAANIQWEASDAAEAEKAAKLKAMPPWLRKWFVGFKQSMGSDPLAGQATGQSDSTKPLNNPRRQAA